jgi:hypothetical protein
MRIILYTKDVIELREEDFVEADCRDGIFSYTRPNGKIVVVKLPTRQELLNIPDYIPQRWKRGQCYSRETGQNDSTKQDIPFPSSVSSKSPMKSPSSIQHDKIQEPKVISNSCSDRETSQCSVSTDASTNPLITLASFSTQLQLSPEWLELNNKITQQFEKFKSESENFAALISKRYEKLELKHETLLNGSTKLFKEIEECVNGVGKRLLAIEKSSIDSIADFERIDNDVQPKAKKKKKNK